MKDENNNRFSVNIGDFRFLDESGNVVPKEELAEYLRKRKEEYDAIPKRVIDFEFLKRGSIVKIDDTPNPIMIEALFIITDDKLYDYGGFEIVNGLKHDVPFYFTHEQIVEIIQSAIDESP